MEDGWVLGMEQFHICPRNIKLRHPLNLIQLSTYYYQFLETFTSELSQVRTNTIFQQKDSLKTI